MASASIMTAWGQPRGVNARLMDRPTAVAAELILKLGTLAQPLRAALTGLTTSPGMFDVLVPPGRDEGLARISAMAAAGADKV